MGLKSSLEICLWEGLWGQIIQENSTWNWHDSKYCELVSRAFNSFNGKKLQNNCIACLRLVLLEVF